MLPSASKITPLPTPPESSVSPCAVMDTTEGRLLAATTSESVVSSGSISMVCAEPLPVASTFVSVMRKAPDMTRAMTSTEPTTRPANDARKMGELLALGLDHGARLGVHAGRRRAAGGGGVGVLRRSERRSVHARAGASARRDMLRMAGVRLTGWSAAACSACCGICVVGSLPAGGTGVGSTSRRGAETGRCSSLDMPSGRWGGLFRHS